MHSLACAEAATLLSVKQVPKPLSPPRASVQYAMHAVHHGKHRGMPFDCMPNPHPNAHPNPHPSPQPGPTPDPTRNPEPNQASSIQSLGTTCDTFTLGHHPFPCSAGRSSTDAVLPTLRPMFFSEAPLLSLTLTLTLTLALALTLRS